MFICLLFFITDPATPEIYTLSLHDALPISAAPSAGLAAGAPFAAFGGLAGLGALAGLGFSSPSPPSSLAAPASAPSSFNDEGDRKSTRLNSSHMSISYAVFCLKKKKRDKNP